MADKLLSTTINTNGVKKAQSINGYPRKPITEIITNGFFTVDQKWTVKYWNKAAEKLLGVSSKDIVGKNLWEKFAGALPLDFYAVYHKAFLQDIPLHFQEYWGEMGAWFDVITYHCDNTLSVSFKSSNQPVPVEYLPHPQYQTQQDHPAQQLKILNELYRFVTEVTNDCLWEWDLQAKELFWIDGGHKRVFGYQVENALIPQSFWESRLHPDDKVRILTRLNKIIAEGSVNVWEDEYRFKKADGEYAFVHDRGHIIYDGEMKASRMIGATQDISARKLAEMQLVEERLKKQSEITEAVLTALENDRADIGKELHDNLNQILALAKLYIQMAQAHDKNREMFLDKACGFIMDVIEEIRRIAKALVKPGMHGIGLFDSIRNLLQDVVMIHPVKIEFQENNIEEEDVNEKLQLTIFRIVQEQVNNILRHANATQAVISLSRQKNAITLLISDNGNGCDILKVKNGVGIINIKSRVELYRGTVSIVSTPGKGYALNVVFPFTDQDELNKETTRFKGMVS
jgi:PAS domain S-box-containing protein